MSGGPMPYVLDKGPYLSVLEDRLSNRATREEILTGLRGTVALSQLVGLDSASLDGDGKAAPDRKTLFETLWFGMTNGTKNPTAPQTGHWLGFQGDPEKILRSALARAIEVSLGLDHSAALTTATRCWPIELYWICQGPYFQCWIAWLQPSGVSAAGQVTMTITTPGAVGHPVRAKITREGAEVKDKYESPPAPHAWQDPRGLWVVGHEDYDHFIDYSTQPSTIGYITVPTLHVRAKSPNVVCVSPNEWEGGVLPSGRRWYVPSGP